MAIKLGDLLVRARLITQEQLAAALEHQASHGGRLGEVLVLSGYVSEEVLVRALSKLTGIPRADLSAGPDVAALARVPLEVAEQCQLVPITFAQDGRLLVAVSDPQNEAELARVREVSGCEVAPLFATVKDIKATRERWYSTTFIPAHEAHAQAAPMMEAPPQAQAQTQEAHSFAAPQPEGPPHTQVQLAQPLTFHEPHTRAHEAHLDTHPSSNPDEYSAPPPLLSLRSGRLAVAGLALLTLALGVSLAYANLLREKLVAADLGLEAHLKTIALQAQQVEALDQLAARVDQYNRDFGSLTGKLQVDELEVGLERLQKKTDTPAKVKELLGEFEKNAADLRNLGAQLKQWQAYLGAPTTVKRGDTHSQIALDYLERQGLTETQAEAVVRQTALAWELEPGNQVYNLYRDGVLLSTVTQGTAARSPLLAQWSQRRAMQQAAQAAESKLRECEAKLPQQAQ
ncbi:MAG: hypothetical protein JST92_23125 [Deltaproteobacteria bacterium]|nr:hypothetical protein [Deltaproteobacteria bacterium]